MMYDSAGKEIDAWHDALVPTRICAELCNEFSDVSSAHLGQARGGPGRAHFGLPCPSHGKSATAAARRPCHRHLRKATLPGLPETRLGKREKGKERSGRRVDLLFIYFFNGKGLTQKQDKN